MLLIVKRYVVAKMRFIMMLMFLSAVFLAGASATAFASCGHKEETGAVFYNFENLFIYYSKFPQYGNNLRSGYPDILKYDNFNERLLKAVKANFAQCLKTPLGTEKPVTVIPPPLLRGTYQEKQALDIDRIHDPKNLTIVVKVSYEPGNVITKGVPEYGLAMFFIYRPEVSHAIARIPVGFNSGMTAFFPTQGDEQLKSRLDSFFNSIRPTATVIPPWIQFR